MIERAILAVSIAMLIGFGIWADNAAKRATRAEAELDGVNRLAMLCDRALVTCVGWQARVALELEAIENVLLEAQRP